MTSVLRAFGSCCLLLLAAGCSAVDPHAGAPQAACGLSSGGADQQGSSYYVTMPTQPTTSPTCESTPDSPCDDCESMHCCATRSACYGDPVCACADLSLDQCLDAAATSATADQNAQISSCWRDFSARGTVEQARLSCQLSWCQAACGIP